jgi:hypothetical protein
VRVKLRVFVLAMKLEANDNDLHIQVADRPAPFDQEQLVVEIPPGSEYCDARSVMMDLFCADGGTRLARHIFRRPPQVELTGYLFLDAAHIRARRTDFCTDNGGRGIRVGQGASHVRGIWELHPVIKVEKAAGQGAAGEPMPATRRRRSPVFSDSGPPPGATARCRDGYYSFSRHRRWTCSYHGGVAVWY